MVSDKIPQNVEPGDNMVKYEMCGCFTIRFDSGHILFPFRELINSHNNMMVPPSRSWVTIHKINPPLGEWAGSDNGMQRGRMRAHILCKCLERVAPLDHINAIFQYGWPKITHSQNFLEVEILDK